MDVSRQQLPAGAAGPRARTRRLMLETASALMQGGATPSVSEVAEAAGVSRATAYRYFPSQAALVEAVVDQALGPILTFKSRAATAEARVEALLDMAMPRIETFEATFKAALRLSLEEWARRRSTMPSEAPQFARGHRIRLLQEAVAPLGAVSEAGRQRLAQALSLVFGIESIIVLEDIWGLDGAEARDVVKWAARALISAVQKEGLA